MRSDTPPPRTGVAEKDVLVGFLDYCDSPSSAKWQAFPSRW